MSKKQKNRKTAIFKKFFWCVFTPGLESWEPVLPTYHNNIAEAQGAYCKNDFEQFLS